MLPGRGEHSSTLNDVLIILKKIADSSYATPRLPSEMLDVMTKTSFEDRLPQPLPEETSVAHKIGSYGSIFSDTGIVLSEERGGTSQRYYTIVAYQVLASLSGSEVTSFAPPHIHQRSTRLSVGPAGRPDGPTSEAPRREAAFCPLDDHRRYVAAQVRRYRRHRHPRTPPMWTRVGALRRRRLRPPPPGLLLARWGFFPCGRRRRYRSPPLGPFLAWWWRLPRRSLF